MSSLAFDPEEATHWEQVRPRHIAPEQWKKFEGYASEIFKAMGMDRDTPGNMLVAPANASNLEAELRRMLQ